MSAARIVLDDEKNTRCSMKYNIYARLFMDKNHIKREAAHLRSLAPEKDQGSNPNVIPVQSVNAVKQAGWNKASLEEAAAVLAEFNRNRDNRLKDKNRVPVDLTPEQQRQYVCPHSQ
jgi:hypothetical protein